MMKTTPVSFSSKKKREAAERLLSLASAHIDNHDTARAIWCAEKALEVDTENRNALLLLNDLYYKKKDYRKTLGISYRLKEIPAPWLKSPFPPVCHHIYRGDEPLRA